MSARELIRSAKPLLKIKTISGAMEYLRSPDDLETLESGSNSKVRSLFESQNSNLWALLYILSFSDSVVEFTEDEEVQEIFNSAKMDMVTDLIYKPLNKASWTDQMLKFDKKMIESVLGRFRNTSIRFSTSPTVMVFLDLLMKGITGLKYSTDMEEELFPVYNGIYKLFEFLGGLSYSRTVHMARIDMKYDQKEFILMESSQQAYAITVYSAHMFCDKRLETLLNIYKQNTSLYKDFLVFNLETEMEEDPKSLLSKHKGQQLALSSLITNIWEPSNVATFRFRYLKDESFWFLVTCQLENSEESIKCGLKEMLSSYLKLNAINSITFKATIGSEVVETNFNDLDSLLKRAFKYRNKLFSKFITIDFEFKSLLHAKLTPKSMHVNKVCENITPTFILEDYYRSRSGKLVHSESSCQLLLIEYNQDLGISVGSLCKDIKSEWLEQSTTYFYQLKGVIVEERSLLGETFMIPIVKLREDRWYSPFHDCSLSGIESYFGINCFIYEKSFTPY
jgi:hypothetical protein